jgi:hypothetical protein
MWVTFRDKLRGINAQTGILDARITFRQKKKNGNHANMYEMAESGCQKWLHGWHHSPEWMMERS